MAYQRKTKDVYAIIWHSQYGTEEVDSFDTKKEAIINIAEYRMAYNEGAFTIKKRRERL